jgi:hypothetical protein
MVKISIRHSFLEETLSQLDKRFVRLDVGNLIFLEHLLLFPF